MELKSKVYTRTNDSGTHYARIIVSKELRGFVLKSALWRSLSTKDAKEAIVAGTLVAVGTQLVLQDVSDQYTDAAVVKVEAEIVAKKLDLAQELEKVVSEDLAIVVASLRKSLGLPDVKKNQDGDSGGDSGSKVSKPEKTAKVSEKTDKKGLVTKLEQTDNLELVLDGQTLFGQRRSTNAADYVEKRPHGVFRFRYWIPKRVQGFFGQREFRQTLKTADRTEAIHRAQPLVDAVTQKLLLLEDQVVMGEITV